MKRICKNVILILVFSGCWLMDFSPGEMPFPTFVDEAEAVVGRPVTPVSAAGVARRTTRRAVYATSASASQQQQQQQQQQAAPEPAAPAAPAAGTIVTVLPAGCESMTIEGGSYFNCAGVIYQPMFQSNNLVYVVK